MAATTVGKLCAQIQHALENVSPNNNSIRQTQQSDFANARCSFGHTILFAEHCDYTEAAIENSLCFNVATNTRVVIDAKRGQKR